jgi:membrane protein CcdC involved in cytochrome C biogenesis
MPPLPFHVPAAVLVLGTLAGAAGMLAWRVRETRAAVSTRRIVAPPLGMSTGFLMFLAPAARVPWSWASGAFALGALVLAVPLARTSRLVRRGDEVRMERSRAFLWILLGLLAARTALRAYVERVVTPAQTGALLFVLAFGMIARWRVGMLLEYRRLTAARSTAGPADGATPR